MYWLKAMPMIVNTLGLEQPGRLSENLYLYSWLHRPQLRVKLWFPFACLQINWFLVEIDLDSEYMKPPLFFESHWAGVHTVTDPCVAYAHPTGALIWITGYLICSSVSEWENFRVCKFRKNYEWCPWLCSKYIARKQLVNFSCWDSQQHGHKKHSLCPVPQGRS